jgi:uncharacterized small protein (DUF1192 family)
MFNDDAPRPKKEYLIGQKLDELSVADLEDVLTELKTEIMRVEAARTRKAGHLSAAESLFSKK